MYMYSLYLYIGLPCCWRTTPVSMIYWSMQQYSDILIALSEEDWKFLLKFLMQIIEVYFWALKISMIAPDRNHVMSTTELYQSHVCGKNWR